MASQKKRGTKKKKALQKKMKPVWIIPACSAFILPCLFALLKKDSGLSVEGLAPIVTVTNPESLKIATCESLEIDYSFQETNCDLGSEISTLEANQEIEISLSSGSVLNSDHLIAFNDESSNMKSNEEYAFQTNTQEALETLPAKENRSRLEIGGNYTYVTIKPGSESSFDGNLGGAGASYEYRPSNSFYGAATFDWKEGSTSSGSSTRSLLFFDVQEKLGYTFSPNHVDLNVSLFSGFGYRYLGQTLDQRGESSLDFGYNEFYFPVGFLSSYKITSWFALGASFSWMPQVYSTVSINPLKGARWKLTNQLANIHAEIPFTFTPHKSFELLIQPFYEYWQDGHSTATLSSGIPLGLPGNTYNFYGVNVNFGYCF